MRSPFLLLSFLYCSAVSAAPVRDVDQVVRSSADPHIEIHVDSQLAYLGHVHGLAMNDRAEYDQYVFAETHGGQLGRAFVVHFEHVRPGVDFSFKYPRFEMVTLGHNEYLHQTWPADDHALFDAPPMRQLLAERSLTAPSRWLVNRYVRALGDDKRSEIILFYLEPASDLPAPVKDLGLGGSHRDLWEPIGRPLAGRAMKMFTVKDLD